MKFLEDNNYSDASKTATGMKGPCCLNKSKFFHIINNKVFVIMHDILSGVGPMIIKLVTHHYIIKQKLFSCSYFNYRVSMFDYGYLENQNKPSANFTDSMLCRKEHTLSQKAMQMWCLIRAYPFLVSEKINEEDEYLELIRTLIRIMEIVFSPRIHKSEKAYFKRLVHLLIESFKTLFPDVNCINKLHHLLHYFLCLS